MTRKKFPLWLNKTKTRKNEEYKGSYDWSTIKFQTSQKLKCVQVPTPIILTRFSPSPLNRAPKWQRIYRPIIVRYDSEYTQIILPKIQAVKQIMYMKCTVTIRIATCSVK